MNERLKMGRGRENNRRGVQKTQSQKTQTSKTQTSQFKTSLKTYTIDENSLRMALIFPIVYGYQCADLAFFWQFDVQLQLQLLLDWQQMTGNSTTQASFVGLGSMIA